MSLPAHRNSHPAWSVVKRLPAYLKLAWALVKEPSIPWRHRAPLYAVLLYEISPPHLLIAAIPVVGQVDSVILLVLAIRHTLRHCPPRIAAQHFANLNLTRASMDEDSALLSRFTRVVPGNATQEIGAKLRFAGRVTRGFTARRFARWSVDLT